MVETGKHVGVAFALVIGAALSTGLGAAVVFFPSLVKLASKHVLASALAFAAGVMVYVSLIEIFQKANSSFVDAGHSDGMAHLYTALCFFGGILIMMALNAVLDFIGGDHDCHEHNTKNIPCDDEKKLRISHGVGHSDDPIGELEEWQKKAAKEEKDRIRGDVTGAESSTAADLSGEKNNASLSDPPPVDDVCVDDPETGGVKASRSNDGNDSVEKVDSDISLDEKVNFKKIDEEHEKARLVKMGLSTALAIALHNFPEGLATFVAALDDPKVGAVLAIALGIHNIPEGLCVALPVYYATGNRLKGFFWGLLSGVTEPIGAVIGWVVLANIMSDNVYAVLFGIVSGMMTFISVKELIPTAFRYDPNDTVVTHSVVFGMFVMASSLVMFAF